MTVETKKIAKISIASALFASLAFSGCSSKSPEPGVGPEGSQADKAGMEAGEGAKDGSVVAADDKITEENVISSDEEGSSSMGSGSMVALESVYFDFDKFNIRPDMQPVVESVGDKLGSETLMSNKVRIEGNCDEWGTDEYNYALGLKRAKSVRDGLERQNVSADRMTLISYGESNPVCSAHNKDCWEKNRRVEFKILP